MGDYIDIVMEQKIPFMEMVRSAAVAFADCRSTVTRVPLLSLLQTHKQRGLPKDSAFCPLGSFHMLRKVKVAV
jgi:hypothetical protein